MTKNPSLFYALAFACALGSASSVTAKATTAEYFKLAIPAAALGAVATGATEAVLDYYKQTNPWFRTLSAPVASVVAIFLASELSGNFGTTFATNEGQELKTALTLIIAGIAPWAANNWAPAEYGYLNGWASHLG